MGPDANFSKRRRADGKILLDGPNRTHRCCVCVRPINDWFVDHPEFALGRLVAGNGAYASDYLTVVLDEPLSKVLHEAVDRLVHGARQRELLFSPRARSERKPERSDHRPVPALPADAKEGSIHRTGRDFVRIIGGNASPYDPSPRKDVAELAALCDLRYTIMALLNAQVASLDDADHAQLQTAAQRSLRRQVRAAQPFPPRAHWSHRSHHRR